ncbi:hypothetical protein H4582DRAFT_2090842 [Lactarius indigo]|nr:hypothetical protein H4582DRAFT_2090842 [Lactarius indigo]
MPANTDAGYDPYKEAWVEWEERMVKNEPQHLRNLAWVEQGWTTVMATGPQVNRKRYVDHTLATTRMSTTNLGKFSRMLDGEKS